MYRERDRYVYTVYIYMYIPTSPPEIDLSAHMSGRRSGQIPQGFLHRGPLSTFLFQTLALFLETFFLMQKS